MATIGSLVVEFGADLRGLSEGIGAAVDLFDQVAERAERLAEQLESLARRDTRISISADSSEVDSATQSVEDLGEAIESASDVGGVSGGLSEVSSAAQAVATSSRDATTFISRFGEVASEAIRRPASDALRGTESYIEMRDSISGIGSTASQSLEAVSSATETTAFAARGCAEAFTSLASGNSAGQFADAAIVAAGRVVSAYREVSTLFSAVLPQAIGEGVTAFGALTATVGGGGAVLAAFQGSSAATAIVIGSLARSFVGVGVALATYSAIMAAARVVLSGLSDEARAYAEAGVSVVAMIVSGAAAARAGAAAYQIVASAMFRSGSASALLSQVLGTVSSATSRLLGPTTRLVSSYATLTSIIGVASTAFQGFSDRQQSVSQTFTQIAGSVARFAATSVAIGAVSGGLNALRAYAVAAGGAMTSAGAGSAALSGAFGGATAAAGGLIATFPAVAAAISVAAVASGRFEQQLESLASKAESIEQMADRFGSSNEGVEKLRIAASNANVSMMALIRSQQNFYTNLSKVKSGQFDSQNTREAKLAFDELGIPVEKLKSLKPEESFRLVAKSLSEVKNAADKTRIAVDLFGARGAFALPALKEIGELEEDFGRLGGAIRAVDFGNIMSMEASFDRLKVASDALSRTMLVPFVSLQRAFNNFAADLKGGLASALAPLATMLNAIAEPLAVIIEAFGRMINVTLRLIGIFTGIAAFFQIFASVAMIFQGIGEGFRAAMKPLEGLIDMFSSAGNEAGIFSGVISVVETVLNGIGVAIGYVIGILANAAIVIVAGAAAWAIYSAAMALASATSITAAFSFAAAWAAALGPFLPVIGLIAGGIALIGGAVMLLAVGIKAAFGYLVGLGQAFGLVSKQRDPIDASAASTKDLAAAAREAQDAASWFSDGENESVIAESVSEARDAFNGLVTESIKYGKAGSDSIASVQKRYADLEQSLADGKISTEEFTSKTEGLFESAEKGMKDYEQSAAVTLQKNLELYKQLDDSVRQVEKSVRDLNSGTVVDGKLFPASEEVKKRAAEYKAEYTAAIDGIKKKQQSGGFQDELNERRSQLTADLESGKINAEQYATMKVELDSTNAQEQAKFAAEDVQREFDRKTAKLKADISFADDIRKKLDEAFLSPVEKFQKELQKVLDNPQLTDAEKGSAEKMLRRDAKEDLFGKTAQQNLTDRTRDIMQANRAGILGSPMAEAGGDGTVPPEVAAELKSAAEEFASAVGVTRTPFEEFSSRLDGVAKQFGFAGQPLDEVRKKLAGNAEQLALFDRAVQEARDSLLQSLGIEKTPEEAFNEQMKKIDEAVNATDPNKRITAEQAEQARTVARRRRDAELGAGEDLGGQFAERQRKIEESFGGGKDPARQGVAMNKLAMDRRQAAGLDATAGQTLKAGVDKINDAFGVTGKSMAEIQATLSPADFAEYQEAVKANADKVKQSLGIEKTGAEQLAETRKKYQKAVADKVITEEEAGKALKRQRDSLLSSLGISKTPAQDFEDAVERIKENAAELSPDELAKGMKEAKDKLLSSLGIDKSPVQAASEQMEKLTEAFEKGQISTEEFADGMQKTRDTMLQSLGIPLDPVTQLAEKMKNLREAMDADQITPEEFARGEEEAKRALLPGGEEESPIKKFQRDLETLERANQDKLISDDDFAQRKLNLQAELEESLAPALDKLAPDRRGVDGSDARSKAGVDTFFRILRGNDNPSLKAQREIAKNTRLLAEASREPEAAPFIAQLPR
jgi:hypothetical protein